MSFLTAAQSAALRLIGRKPSAFFSSTNQFEQEICDLANEVAKDVVDAHEWRLLTILNTITGDGSTVGFDLPSDYDRMLKKGAITRPDWATWRYTPCEDTDQWQDLINGYAAIDPGFWIILGGQLQFWPALPSGETAQHYYISNKIVENEAGTAKATFTADDDTFRIDERLLTLGLVWRWREQKRLDFTGDKENFDLLLDEMSADDKGRQIMSIGGNRSPVPFGPFGFRIR
jgi:hypothetical protein